MQEIPLVRADLTVADEQAVRQQLRHAPFRDDALLTRWESAWEDLWQRPALAFAEPAGLLMALKTVLGWHSGDGVEVDPLVDPAWKEALSEVWLHLQWRDIDPGAGGWMPAAKRQTGTGQTEPGQAEPEQAEPGQAEPGQTEPEQTKPGQAVLPASPLRAGLWTHPYGLPTRCTHKKRPAFWLEDISSVLQPMPVCGWGDVQVLHLSGNRMLAAGASCLLLTQDEALFRALRSVRRHPPAPLACALGLSQLQGLPGRLERRQVLAERYQALRGHGVFQGPGGSEQARVWEMFLLEMTSGEMCMDLQRFLKKSRIHAAPPLWFRPEETGFLPHVQRFRTRVLALPLYASLTDPDHKRITNRVHRWVARILKQGNPLA